VVIENIETRLNLEVGDETGFSTEISVPLKKAYKSISRGQVVEMLVMSYRPDLSSFAKVSDVYLPDLNLWLSDYPCLRRDAFIAPVSGSIGKIKIHCGDSSFFLAERA
jgi:hypothetical protein